MTFKTMLAADVLRLIDTDYFASEVIYTDPSGQATDLTVVLFDESTETPEVNGVITKLRTRDCTWSAATLSDVNQRATITIGTPPDAEDWSIAGLVYRDEYQVTVRLERHELTEHTRPNYRRR